MYNTNSILCFVDRIEYNNIVFEHYILERERVRREGVKEGWR